jgi:hypothetical protein
MFIRSMTTALLGVLVLGGSTLATAGSTRSVDPSDFAREALVNLLARSHMVVQADEDLSFDTGSCIYAGFVKRGKSVSIVKDLDEDKSYMFVAAGDDDVTDVDIQVLRNGKVVAEDTMDDNEPYVKFTPSSSAEYTVKVILYEADADSFVGLCCLSDDGWDVPVSRLDSAVNNILDSVDAVLNSQDGAFLQASNSWCIYGGVLESDSDWFSITNIVLNNPPYLIVGTSDNDDADVDLQLKRSGSIIASDTEDDNVPVVAVEKSGTYEVKILNHGRPSLSMFTILDVTGE